MKQKICKNCKRSYRVTKEYIECERTHKEIKPFAKACACFIKK